MKSIHDDDIEQVGQTRTNFLVKNNINPTDTTLANLKYEGDDYQRYFIIDDSYRGDGIVRESTMTCDAVVTLGFNHALFLPLADCVGAVLHDPVRNILMVSHLGRHNLEQFGGTACVDYLINGLGVDPADLNVWLSPAAGKGFYPLFDFNNRSLHEVALEQLVNAGVLSANIEISSIDSAGNDDYYSHSQFMKGNRASDGRFAIVTSMSR